MEYTTLHIFQSVVFPSLGTKMFALTFPIYPAVQQSALAKSHLLNQHLKIY